MDPTAAWKSTREALNDGDMESFRNHYLHLMAWLGDGGFPPQCARDDWRNALTREQWRHYLADLYAASQVFTTGAQ